MKNNLIRNLAIAAILQISFAFQNVTAQSYSLFGVTQSGGTYNKGVIYKYNYPSGPYNVVANFNDTNGSAQWGCLIVASDGNIYGMTSKGGANNEGVMYRLNPRTYQDTVLINFNGANGSNAITGFMQASNGLLYGLTAGGGAYNKGVFFSYNIFTKTQTVLFSFDDSNGAHPTGHCIQAYNGLIYGHTTQGGTYGDGVIFSYDPGNGHSSVVHSFSGSDGNEPRGFMQASNGLMYGNTYSGGDSNEGVFYSYNPANNAFSVIINFSGLKGEYPSSDANGLLEASNGLIYGITQMGGTYNMGLFYSYNPITNKDSILINFAPSDILGDNPFASGYTQIPGCRLVVPVDSGGAYSYGTLISYDQVSGQFVKLFDFNGANGSYPTTGLVLVSSRCNLPVSSLQSTPFPNPTEGIVSISVQNYAFNGEIEIYDMTGDKVYTGKYIEKSYINLQNQPKGLYLYRVISYDGSEISRGKFIIQ